MSNSANIKKPYFVASTKGPVSSAEIVIIQCPGCDTRFRVSDSSLSEFSDPNFHCSRCDLVFHYSESLGRQLQTPTEFPTLSVVPPLSTDTDSETLGPEILTPENITAEKNNSGSSLYSIKDLAPKNIAIQEPLFKGESVLAKNKFEIPKNNLQDLVLSAPHETNSISEEKQLEFEFPKNPKSSLFSKINPMKVGVKNETSKTPIVETKKDPLFSIPARANFSNQTSGVLFISSLVFILLTIVAIATVIINGSSTFKKELAAVLIKDSNSIPDPEIQIISPVVNRLTLSSGEQVYLIKGTVINNSSDVINDIVIQGIFFDSNGEKIGSAKSYVGSILTRSTIENLALNTLLEIQKTAPTSQTSLLTKNRLLPSKTADFAIVIPANSFILPINGAESGEKLTPKFFSVRVFSRGIIG